MSKGRGHQRVQPLLVTYPQGVKEIACDQPKDELIRRLKVLARSFQDMEQEEEATQYEPLALYLVTGGFFRHPNKDVRLLVACCIADIFRVFAPEAPYRTADQLRVIFQFLNKQLWGLENVEGPSWKRYFYLLENLAMVKSFNICMELEDCNELFVELFNVFFSIISDSHTPKVRTFMLDIMCPLISENDAVPADLLELILANLLESKKAENPHAFQMAKELVKRTATSIEPSIQAFFNNVLILGKTTETELAGHTYELIYQLNTISSTLLLSVLPQLEFKLKSNDERERLAVTKLLGRMFSNKDSDLASQNKALWNCFLGRFSDISISIRTECVKFVKDFIMHHSYLISDIIEKLRARVHDTDEGVRQEVVSAMASTAKKDITNISDEMLTLIKDRTLDKKWKIRKEAVLGLAHIYKKWYNSEELSAAERKRLTWIKDKVLHMYYQPIIDDRLLVERIFSMTLVPYTLEVKQRMKALLHLFATVDRHAVKALIEMMKNQHVVRTHVRELMEVYKKDKAERSKLIHPKLVSISKNLPEPTKAVEHLKKLASVLEEDLKARAAMEKVVDPKVTCRRAAQSVGEVMKKFGNPSQPTPLYETLRTLMERIAPLVIDAAAIKELVAIVADHVEGLAPPFEEKVDETAEVRGLKLLQTLAPVFPSAFRSEASLALLISMLRHEDDTVSDVALQIFIHTGQNLKEDFPNMASCLLPILLTKAKTGIPSQAKHAVRCLNVILSKDKLPVFQQLYESLQRCLNLDHEHHLTALTAVGEMARLGPEPFCLAMKPAIASSVVKGLLMQDQTEATTARGIWCHDNQVGEEALAKIAAMKLLVHWLEGLRGNPDTSPCVSTIRLLMTMIKNEGDLMERKVTSKADMSRLRLAAACSMLKLAQVPVYQELISIENFQHLALMINDECYQVRELFARKLNKALNCLRLPLSYMAIFSLCTKDPVKESRANAKQYLLKNIQNRREYLKQHTVENAHLLTLLPEYVIPYTVHLLAHDPDFSNLKDMEGLRDTRECMWFILEPLVTKSENCSFLRKLIETIKQMKDAQKPEDRSINRKLYAVCDIALGLLMTKTQAFTQKEHPVKPLLPRQLFVKPRKPLMNTECVLPKKLQEEFTQQETKKKSLTDKLLETPPQKGVRAGRRAAKAEGATPPSPASPAASPAKTPRGDENQPALASGRRSTRTDSVASSGSSKLNGRERKSSTRTRGSALAENHANSSTTSSSPRKRTIQTPIKRFLTRSKSTSAGSSSASSSSPSSSLSSTESGVTAGGKPSRKRSAGQSPASPAKRARNKPGPKPKAKTNAKANTKAKAKASPAVRTAQTKVAQAKAARAKTLAVKKLRAAATAASSPGRPAARKPGPSSATRTRKAPAGSAKATSPVKKLAASPVKKPGPSPVKKSLALARRGGQKMGSSSSSSSPASPGRGQARKASPRKVAPAKISNGALMSPPKRTTVRRDSLNSRLSQSGRPRPQRPSLSSPQASPVRYSPRKSVLAGPLTTFQKRRAPAKPSPRKRGTTATPPATTRTTASSPSSEEEEEEDEQHRPRGKRKASEVDGSGDKSLASPDPSPPKKLRQTTLNFNLRKAGPRVGTPGVNGVSTSDEDSSETMGRPSRQERALVRAIEVAGAKRSPQTKAASSLNIRRSNRRRKY